MKRKGNTKAQRQRRRKYMRQIPRQPDLYELIDGNWSHYPVGYCRRYDAYVTMGLVKTHKCIERECIRYETCTFCNIVCDDNTDDIH